MKRSDAMGVSRHHIQPGRLAGLLRRAIMPVRVYASKQALCLLLSALTAVSSRAGEETVRNLGELSLEELMNESVTSVSKKEQRLGDVASAVSVLTNDDIRRSGAGSLADVLRLVPGLDVASANAREWAISSRGFNNVYANKLLVLVDGRTVYSPLFAGVYWDMQQTMLEDVDRIEVIRGPGGTIWGANAVNGVINIATRSAKDTQGGLLYGESDGHAGSFGARYGGTAGAGLYYRVFAGTVANADHPLPGGQDAGDGWRGNHGGVRVDYLPDPVTHVTWQAQGTEARDGNDAALASNLNTLVRWRRDFSPRSGLEAQAYFDRDRREPGIQIGTTASTADFSLQHTLQLGEHHEFIWGANYRHIDLSLGGSNPEAVVRDHEFGQQLFGAFAQDEVTLVPQTLSLTLGTKIEHNDLTGVELQPGARAVYKPTKNQRWWAAVSRAVRTPDVIEGRDAVAVVYGAPFPGPGGGAYVPALVGNPAITSEAQWAYEAGYRAQLSPRVSVDVTAFYNRYRHLISFGPIERFLPAVPVGLAEIPWANNLTGRSYGGEVVLTVMPRDTWRMTAAYSLLVPHFEGPASGDPTGTEKNSPRNQFTLRSSYDFTSAFSLDAQFRHVGAILSVPGYTAVDARFSWRLSHQAEISLSAENLLDPSHLEQAPVAYSTIAEVPRTFKAKLSWRF